MKIVVTGAKGMLGRTLLSSLSDHEIVPADLPELDVTDGQGVEEFVGDNAPDIVIHCAAMTAVDDCETEREKAFRINADGTANVARACTRTAARLIHVSTDYVFSGDLDRPYIETDATGPRTIYGASKLRAEDLIQTLSSNFTIVRISWLYGPGGPSFLHAISRLAQQRDTVKVVADQVGNPTSTDAVAAGLRHLLDRPLQGIVHLTCEGEASWFEFAREIVRLKQIDCALVPCSTEEFPRPAPRPRNSRLENKVLRDHGYPPMIHWQAALEQFCSRDMRMTSCNLNRADSTLDRKFK